MLFLCHVALVGNAAHSSETVDLKALILLLQEEMTRHEISQICCVVRDEGNPNIFGYATTTSEDTAQNTAHVFTTESPVSNGKCLSRI